METGIYLIQCGDRKYVGQARDIAKRWREHIRLLENNKHNNHYLQNIWNKYKDKFEFLVLETCNIDELNDKEVYWINELNTLSPSGMNLIHGGDVRTPSEETRRKIGETGKLKTVPIETRKRISDNSPKTWLGKTLSDEHRKKISINHADMSGKNNPNWGRKFSDEVKQRMSNAHKGKSNPKNNKLTDDEVRKIKELRKQNPKHYTYRRLGEMFGCHNTNISLIINGKSRGNYANI